jgi:hypothetical protein
VRARAYVEEGGFAFEFGEEKPKYVVWLRPRMALL